MSIDPHDITPAGKRKFIRWLNKQTLKHNQVNIALLIKNSPSEFKLFKMCRFIDKCYAARQEARSSQTTSEVSEHDLGPESSSEGCDEPSPEFKTSDDSAQAPVVENIDYRAKHKALLSPTQIKYNAFSSRTKGRINAITQTHMDVPISKMISDATDEAEVIQLLDEIESREASVNPEVRKWTCRVI